MKKRRWAWFGAAFAIFLVSFFVGGPALRALMDRHQPYLLVDPDVQSEVGCEYDYLSYLPVEVTGRDPSEGVRFAVAGIPEEYAEYVHYPDSWENPLNPFNPANNFAQGLKLTLNVLLGVLCVSFVAYLCILWRRGKLKKMKEKLEE